MVVLYETSKIIFNYKNNVRKVYTKSNIASSQHIETLKSNLFTLLHKINYIKIGNHDKKKCFSKIIAEKKLSTKEVNILQGIIQKAEKKDRFNHETKVVILVSFLKHKFYDQIHLHKEHHYHQLEYLNK